MEEESVQVIPFKAEHAIGMKVRDLEPEMEKLVCNEAYLRFLETAGPGYTLKVYGVVVGCMVFCRLLMPGVCEVVFLASPEIETCKSVLHRIAKRCVDDVQKSWRRMECRIAQSRERDRKWAERLGFRPEGIVRRFGLDGEDYVQYGRTGKDE